MFVTFKFKDAIPLCVALMLIFVVFLLPEYPVSEREEAVSVFAAGEPVLIIDAGHGGFDGGAVGSNGTTEQDINLSIAQRVQALAGFFGVRTALTRADENALDYDPSRPVRENKIADIKAREQLVQDTADPVFLSIHLNKFSDAQYHGAQVFYADEASSLGLAQHTQELLRLALDPENRRQAARLPNTVYLMTHITCRAILVECGFLSNPEEEGLLQDPKYQTKLAAAIAAGCLVGGSASS